MKNEKDKFPTSPGCPAIGRQEFQQIEAHHTINLLPPEFRDLESGKLQHYFTIIDKMNTSQLIRFTASDNSGASILANIVCFEVDPIGMREGWGNVLLEKLPELKPNVNDATGMDHYTVNAEPIKADHELKIWPNFFLAVKHGHKTFELRKNDRDFKAGDIVNIREYATDNKKYTGNNITVEITYVLTDAALFGLKDGYCIFSFKPLGELNGRG